MSSLTVAVDATAAAPGGGVSYLSRQLPALAADGVRLIVFARADAARRLAPHLPGATFVTVQHESLLGRQIYVHCRLITEARRRGARALYCPGSVAPLWGRIPIVLCIQNPHLFSTHAPRSIRHTLLRLGTWASALRARFVVHVSESMAAEFRSTSALRAPTAVVLSGAGDLDARRYAVRDAATTPARPYLLAVSNLYGYKRMDIILRAYASAAELHDPYDLVIAGGEIRSGAARALRLQAQTLGFGEDRVRLPGFVSGEALAHLYLGASLYVSASEREAFPLTPAEALIAGIPVVLTDIPPFSELYGEWATFAPMGDARSLAAAMVTALEAGPRREAADAVSRRFSWEQNGRELAGLLHDAVTAPPPGLVEAVARIRPRAFITLARTVVGRRGE